MHVAPRTLTTPDGRSFRVRAAHPAESGTVLDHAWRIHATEPEVNVAEADEIALDVDRMRALLERLGGSDNGLFLLAESGGQVLGTLSLEGGRHRRLRHVAALGMSVRREWRRRGVGRALLETAVDAARASGTLRRITLRVFATNDAARGLYAAAGFREEGRLRGQILLGGAYVDEVLMALDLV